MSPVEFAHSNSGHTVGIPIEQRTPSLHARIRGRVTRTIRREALYRGKDLECPICDATFSRFADFRGRPQAHCPACLSAERHRLLWLYLRDETSHLHAAGDVLHVAPEAGIARRLRGAPGIRYLSIDIDGSRAMVAADLTALQFRDCSFAVVICSHVLEHVPDDRAAIAEIHRVLRPGGTAYLQHPVDYSLTRTVEHLSTASVPPAERLARFGHEEHVRTYGRDLCDRLQEAGFMVTIERYIDRLPADVVRRHRLEALPAASKRPPGERIDDIYVCRRLP